MTITELIDSAKHSDNLICPRCGTSLPPYARFCSSCGEQIKKEKKEEREACPGKDNDQAQEQEIDDTLRLPALTRDRLESLQLDLSFKNIGILIHHPWLVARSLLNRVRSHSLLRNSIYIMGTGVATSIFGYLFWILAAHLYSTYDVGLGSALISAVSLASIIANMGIGSTLVQLLPRRKAGYEWSLTLNASLAVSYTHLTLPTILRV